MQARYSRNEVRVELRASVRQIIEAVAIEIWKELVLLWVVGHSDIQLHTSDSALQDLRPQLLALQLSVPDYDAVFDEGDSCEASDTVVEHDQVHWNLCN